MLSYILIDFWSEEYFLIVSDWTFFMNRIVKRNWKSTDLIDFFSVGHSTHNIECTYNEKYLNMIKKKYQLYEKCLT